MKIVYKWLTQLTSRTFTSRLTGTIAKSRFSKYFIRHFARLYAIPIEDAEKNVDEYATLNAFFTRRLRTGIRPIDADPDTLVSPVDGRITAFGPLRDGTRLDVKGQTYTITDLLAVDNESASVFERGHFIVFYLSPQDYHRIHAPMSGSLTTQRHVGKKVFPVHDFALEHVRHVLSRNVRVISTIEQHNVQTAVVKVGALNVASIRLHQQLANPADFSLVRIQKGEELGYFEFGSTVVLLINDAGFQFHEALECGKSIKMGEAIGRIHFEQQTREL